MNRLPALFIALVLALTVVAAPVVVSPEQNAAQAATGDCRITYILCGRVANHPLSHSSLYATYSWGSQWSATSLVHPGRSSSSTRDADGYYIRAGYKAWHVSRYSGARVSPVYYGPRWVKVGDLDNPWVLVRRR